MTRWADGDTSAEYQQPVSVEDVVAGIRLARWFGNEWRRLFGMFYETNEVRDQRRLVEWIERKGGSVTARKVQQGHRQFRTAHQAEAALEELAKAGCGNWEPTPPGRRGQPSRRFVLSTVSTVYGNSLKPDENRNTVDVDSVDGPETQPDDDWGEL